MASVLTRDELRAILEVVVSKRKDRCPNRAARIEAILDVVIEDSSMYAAEQRHGMGRNTLSKSIKGVQDFIDLAEGLKSRNLDRLRKQVREELISEGWTPP